MGLESSLTLLGIPSFKFRFVQKSQLPMDKTKIKTIGFSLVRQDGEFELEIKSIKASNTPFTLGDYDILQPGEVVDENGFIKKDA